ncbi:MAG: carboxypeptidase-like regulatory domain-containing protein, partial [Bacteroidaceae bacterium]|nr:carboxypeptidase-like regulatory domain-containing protein [Bacteroidaceae bacterium]
MRKAFTLCLFILSSCLHVFPQAETFVIRGKVIDKDRREGIPYCNVYIDGDSTSWTPTDSMGNFRMAKAKPGIHRFFASSIGYKATLTAEYLISATTPFVEIELQEDTRLMGEISVGPQLMRTTSESPVSLYVIGMQDIEKMPGANRDISRIVRSFPGVSFSPIGYRNDLIVRGGGPAENRFFMDGIEIPNINHFATQGTSGGPTSIVNADLVREINFYTGAFPANRSGALSSVLDFALVNGNPDRQSFKATLGASEVSLSGNGHLSPKTTYLFSVRQSYLQLLFKMLGLPFLPNYIDGQFKIKSRITPKDEIMVMGLGGIDRMK